MFSCVVWWILLGSLLGTLLSWALGNALAKKKEVESPELINKISILEKENSEIPELRSKIRLQEKNKPRLEHTLELKKKDELVDDLKTRLSDLLTKFEKASYVLHERNEKISLLQPPTVDIQQAQNLGLKLKSNDDFEIIEGIGPVISILLNQNGINSFHDLSKTSLEELRSILSGAGPNFRLSDPSKKCLRKIQCLHIMRHIYY